MSVSALIAVICFAVAFILKLLGESLGKFDLVILGLFFVALHLLLGAGAWWRRTPA
jgi:hypothetical protein